MSADVVITTGNGEVRGDVSRESMQALRLFFGDLAGETLCRSIGDEVMKTCRRCRGCRPMISYVKEGSPTTLELESVCVSASLDPDTAVEGGGRLCQQESTENLSVNVDLG